MGAGAPERLCGAWQVSTNLFSLRGKSKLSITTTLEEYRKHVGRPCDGAFPTSSGGGHNRPGNPDSARGAGSLQGSHHKVAYTGLGAYGAGSDVSTVRVGPGYTDKAIDLIDEAGARLSIFHQRSRGCTTMMRIASAVMMKKRRWRPGL